MSGAQSISTRRAYGVQRVCRVWHRARSSAYARRQATRSPAPCRRRGPIGAAPDDVLVVSLAQKCLRLFRGASKARSRSFVVGIFRNRRWASGCSNGSASTDVATDGVGVPPVARSSSASAASFGKCPARSRIVSSVACRTASTHSAGTPQPSSVSDDTSAKRGSGTAGRGPGSRCCGTAILRTVSRISTSCAAPVLGCRSIFRRTAQR